MTDAALFGLIRVILTLILIILLGKLVRWIRSKVY